MSDEQTYQIGRLNAALETSGNTIVTLEKKLAVLQDLIGRMEHDKKNMEQIKLATEEIIKKQLEFADKEKEKLQNEIMELRQTIKDLRAA